MHETYQLSIVAAFVGRRAQKFDFSSLTDSGQQIAHLRNSLFVQLRLEIGHQLIFEIGRSTFNLENSGETEVNLN